MNKSQINALARMIISQITKDVEKKYKDDVEKYYLELNNKYFNVLMEWIKRVDTEQDDIKINVTSFQFSIENEKYSLYLTPTNSESNVLSCLKSHAIKKAIEIKQIIPTFQDIADQITVSTIQTSDINEITESILQKYKTV